MADTPQVGLMQPVGVQRVLPMPTAADAPQVGLLPPMHVEKTRGTQGGLPDIGLDRVNSDALTPPDLPSYTPEYSFSESAAAGFRTTAIAYAYDALEEPDFVDTPGFDPRKNIEYNRDNFGVHLSETDETHMMRSGSQAEWEWRSQVLKAEQNDAKRAAQFTSAYLAGGVLDADIVVGGAVGLATKAAKLGKVASIATNAGVTGTTVGGAFVAGGTVRPISPADQLINALGVTAGAILGEAITKRRPKALEIKYNPEE